MQDVHIKLTVAGQIQRDIGPGHRMHLFTLGGHIFRGHLQSADEEQVSLISDQPPSDNERVLIPTENVVAFSRLY